MSYLGLDFLRDFKFKPDGKLFKGEKKRMTLDQVKLYNRAYSNMYYEKRRRDKTEPIKRYNKDKIDIREYIQNEFKKEKDLIV